MLNWKIHKMVFIIQIWRLTVLTFQICMDGSILAFLKCMDTSVRTYLNGSVWSHLRFSNNLLTLDLHSLEISVYHSYYARKATKLPIWNRMANITFAPKHNYVSFSNQAFCVILILLHLTSSSSPLFTPLTYIRYNWEVRNKRREQYIT